MVQSYRNIKITLIHIKDLSEKVDNLHKQMEHFSKDRNFQEQSNMKARNNNKPGEREKYDFWNHYIILKVLFSNEQVNNEIKKKTPRYLETKWKMRTQQPQIYGT